jgi:hypothetical protein
LDSCFARLTGKSDLDFAISLENGK